MATPVPEALVTLVRAAVRMPVPEVLRTLVRAAARMPVPEVPATLVRAAARMPVPEVPHTPGPAEEEEFRPTVARTVNCDELAWRDAALKLCAFSSSGFGRPGRRSKHISKVQYMNDSYHFSPVIPVIKFLINFSINLHLRALSVIALAILVVIQAIHQL